MKGPTLARLAAVCAIVFIWQVPSYAEPVSIALVPVGDAGNEADTATNTTTPGNSGAVPYQYSIGRFDVTASQYTAFLNAVAGTDTYGLYNSNMQNTSAGCGIQSTFSGGSLHYTVTKNGDFPVNWVSWADATRFVNWLQNGQPNGPEGPGTTETGTYTLNGITQDFQLKLVTRNAGATWVIPTDDEWYKAAYFKGNGTNAGYWSYPTRSDTMPSNLLSVIGTNNANYYDQFGTGNHTYTDTTNFLTPAGAFAGSPGPYGTFDQGGDVAQWTETLRANGRTVRGGSFAIGMTGELISVNYNSLVSSAESDSVGFRVAAVPEPSSLMLLVIGAVGLGAFQRRRSNFFGER